MKRLITGTVAAAVLVLAAVVWRLSDPTGESAGPIATADPGQAAVERTLERTQRESRSGAEEPPTVRAPLDGAPPQSGSPPRTESPEPGVDTEQLPEGYSLGAYRGPMQRAPRTGVADLGPSPNPAWLDDGSAQDEILEQVARSGRPFTFAVLRVLPGSDLQALDQSLAALGSRIEGSTGSYVRARVPAERSRLESIAALPGVLGIGAVPPDIKADAAFVREMRSRPAGEQAPVYITLMAPDPTGEWRQALSGLGVVVGAYDGDLRSYTANLPAAALSPVMAADFVLAVESIPVVTVNHDSSVPVMGVDGFRDYDPAMERFTGITGSGIAVGVLDTGLNTSHVDIARGRASICGANFVTQQNWDLWLDLGGHGTHVFGTIAGAGRVNPLLAGIAPGLSHLRFGKVLSAYGFGSGDDIRRGMDYLSRATGCSWQGTVADAVKPLIVNMSLSAASLAFSGRGVGERKLDSVVRAHSQLYVVAQANAGVHGFSNYGTAKNSLAVGAVDDAGIIAPFSSHGPTADGRLAPNVVGTGVRLTSARGAASVSGHATFSGTSMAAPSVAGVAALLMQARPEFRNRPALTRARLMASAIRPHTFLESPAQLPADNSGDPGAFNNRYGLGLVSARTTLLSRDDPEGWLIGSATSQPDGDSYEYIDIEVPEGAGRLDVVLTWDEQPADTLTRSVLNNLDLWADEGGDCAEAACGEHASRSEVDNVEWLLIEDPVPGTYRIKVVPVEVYGESSTAAVAWKILRAEPTPELRLEVNDTSVGDSEYLTVDVTIDANRFVASATTIHLTCRNSQDCRTLRQAYRPIRNDVYREDGLTWAPSPGNRFQAPRTIPIGEVAAGTPRRVQLAFLRETIPPGSVLHVTATSWNAGATGQSLAISVDAAETDSDFVAPANDSFSGSERIEGTSGETPLDLALASREPGEPLVASHSRTLWYVWEAPAKGLFRFRLQESDSGDPVDAGFALFTGDKLTDLDMAAEKQGNEISFAAQAGTVYTLRVASEEWDLPPLRLTWESADSRPANDDLAYAQALEGESGSIDSTNEGATLENLEFQGGAAATVWYEWTAPRDGWWSFEVNRHALSVTVFAGDRIGELRLLSDPARNSWAHVVAREGETYRIAVAARSADASGTDFTLSWRSFEQDSDIFADRYLADNDLFQNAIEIGGPSGSVSRFILSDDHGRLKYTVEHGEPIATGIATGWWQWTAPSDGRVTWRMGGSSAYRLTFFAGDALDNLQLLGSLRGGSALVLDATEGARYWIAMGRSPEYIGDPANAPESFTWGPTPANDDRTAASPLVGTAGSAEVVLSYATRASDDPTDTVGTDSVWWHWRAPTSGWQRFWVEGHSLSTILGVYPDSVSMQAIADSERSFLANGRVELHVLAQAGHRYDIRLSSRPGVSMVSSARLGWEPADAPASLAYKGAVEIHTLAGSPVAQGFRSPRNLAMSDDGHYLFSSSDRGLYAFLRDNATGEIALARRANADSDQDMRNFRFLRNSSLWWSSRYERLFAMHLCFAPSSFGLAESDSSSLVHERVNLLELEQGQSSCEYLPGVGDSDGKYYYLLQPIRGRLDVFRIDTPTQITIEQSISARGASSADQLVIPNLGLPVDLALSPDGLVLYLLSDQGLFTFSRDTSTGELALAAQLSRSNDPGGLFSEMADFRDVAVDANGTVLFVAGQTTNDSAVFDSAIAAFDIATDPSEPAHLHTLTQMYFEQHLDAILAWNHLKPHLNPPPRRVFDSCDKLVPHADLPAVDVFCREGFFVVRRNLQTNALEVTDFAQSGKSDRFGHTLAFLGAGQRQMAQSPNGAHVYGTSSLLDGHFTDAIHVFERASAMEPAEDDEGGGDDVAGTAYDVDDILPGLPASGVFVPEAISGGSVTITGNDTTIALDRDGYFELSDGTRYTCTATDGCSILNGTVTAGTVTRRAAGSGEVDRFPSFRTAINPGDQTYTVGTAIDTLALPAARGGNGTLSYTLTPSVPGLTFNAATRQLAGTPSTAGTYAMTFTVTDEDGDTDTLSFSITVMSDASTEVAEGDCYVGLLVNPGESCTYPGTTDEFSVNVRGRGSFLGQLAGIRIRINNQTIGGRVYDFEASHQGDGVWRIDRIAGSTEVPTNGGTDAGETGTDTSPMFVAGSGPGDQTYTVGTAIDTLTLPEASGGNGSLTYSLSPDVPGLAFNATSRQLTGTPTTVASYNMTYTATDGDGDADTLKFSIAVAESDAGGDDGDDADGSDSAISVGSGTCSGRRILGSTVSVSMTGTVTANVAVSNVRVTGRANGSFVGIEFLGSIAAGESEDFSMSGIITTSASTIDCTVDVEFLSLGAQGHDVPIRAGLGRQMLN